MQTLINGERVVDICFCRWGDGKRASTFTGRELQKSLRGPIKNHGGRVHTEQLLLSSKIPKKTNKCEE